MSYAFSELGWVTKVGGANILKNIGVSLLDAPLTVMKSVLGVHLSDLQKLNLTMQSFSDKHSFYASHILYFMLPVGTTLLLCHKRGFMVLCKLLKVPVVAMAGGGTGGGAQCGKFELERM